jgi:LPS export ABC transporter permease LptG
VVKKVDRFIIGNFLPPFVMCLVVVYGLFAAFDILQDLNDLLREEGRGQFGTLMRYYLYYFPVFVAELAPGALLISAGLALVGMSRRREILALKATGVSFHRVTLPIFIVTALVSLGIFYLKEEQLPMLASRCEEMKGRIKQDVRENVLISDHDGGFYLHVDEYDRARKTMKRPLLVYRREDGSLRETVQAARGEWKQGRMVLSEILIHRFSAETGLQEGASEKLDSLAVETKLTPRDLDRAEEQASAHYTLGRLRRLSREQPDIPAYRVMLHSKLSSVFGPVVLLFLGLPLIVGSQPAPRGRFLGVSICIAVSALYYVLTFVCSNMGNAGMINAVLAGWLPTIMLGAVGIILFDNLRT